jgi:hypothetical protein
MKNMWFRFVLAASLALCLAVARPAAADALDDFNAAVEAFSAHHRVALFYLRTGNVDLAVIEIERMREAWSAVVDRFGARPPDVITDRALYTLTLTDMATRMIGVHMVLDMGRTDVAAEALASLRGVLARLRRASGIAVLADCVLDANTAMDALFGYRNTRLDPPNAAVAPELRAIATRYGDTLTRCEMIAPERTLADPEFRRLVDGARSGLALLAQAVEHRDQDLMARVLDELRALDRLLAFRFG